jgi:hypothetical protein
MKALMKRYLLNANHILSFFQNQSSKQQQTGTSMNIGGIYTDPLHASTTGGSNIFGFSDPWFGGLRFIGRKNKDGTSTPSEFTTIGCDDGFYFWVLTGEFTDMGTGAINMDFTPKAPGVGLLKCSYAPGALSFLDDNGKVGNTWSRLLASSEFDLAVATKHPAFNNVNGLYVDPLVYKPGSFAGIRVVSDRLGKILRDEICVVGTDDGKEWWSLDGGAFVDKVKGKFSVGSLSGTCHNGTIKFDNGKEWTKMAIKSNMHSLPKESLAKI